MAECYFCKNEIIEENGDPELLLGNDPDYEGLGEIHDEEAI